MGFSLAASHLIQSTRKFGLQHQTHAIMVCGVCNRAIAEVLPALAEQCVAVQHREGVISIRVQSAAARGAFMMHREAILERVQRQCEGIVGIEEIR
ncbi:DUF721 domain-containing protein [Candidatus Peribacteria bacterium]|nr:DUF721 domain-containing protein [Candidatus Peribacteria bacterium]